MRRRWKAITLAIFLSVCLVGVGFALNYAFSDHSPPTAAEIVKADGFRLLHSIPAKQLPPRTLSQATGRKNVYGVPVMELVLVVKPEYVSTLHKDLNGILVRSGGSAHISIDGQIVRITCNILVWRMVLGGA